MIDARFRPMEKRVNITGETRKAGFKVQWARVLDELERELNHIDAADTIIEGGFASSQIRNDGWPRGGCSPAHQDIRLFCTAKVGPLVFSCGYFSRWEDNLRAIGLVLQDLRLMKERGVGSGTEQYRGYTALPPGAGQAAPEWGSVEDAVNFLRTTAEYATDPRQCPGVPGWHFFASSFPFRYLYRDAARKAHPDAGGNNELMAKVNRAKDFIERGGAS